MLLKRRTLEINGTVLMRSASGPDIAGVRASRQLSVFDFSMCSLLSATETPFSVARQVRTQERKNYSPAFTGR